MSSWNPFSSANVPGVKTLKRDHTIEFGGFQLVKGPGEGRRALPDEDKNKFAPDTYFILDKYIEGTVLKAGTPYREVTIRGQPNKLFIIDGKQILISEPMTGGRRKKRRTMRRKNKARRQSRKFR